MNTRPSGVAQCAATVGELADHRDHDVLEPGLLDRAAEERAACPCGRCGDRRGARRGAPSPAWFSSEPRWWSTVNSTRPAPRARRRRGRSPTSRSTSRSRAAGRAAPPRGPPSCSARPSSSGMKPTAARAASSSRSVHDLQGTLPRMEPETQAPDRNLAMELVRVTEAAALAAGRWIGRGDKNAADGAAVDAMRLVLNSVVDGGRRRHRRGREGRSADAVQRRGDRRRRSRRATSPSTRSTAPPSRRSVATTRSR